MDFRRFFIDMLIENHRFERESTESETLQSAPLNFWKMEGAQKVTFSIQNLYSQMHFRSQMCPGGHLEGFEACLKRRSELRTWARNLFVFQRKIKDFSDKVKKIIGFSYENQRFQRSR